MTSYKKGTGAANSYTYYPDNMCKSKGSTTQAWIDDEIALDLSGTSTVVISEALLMLPTTTHTAIVVSIMIKRVVTLTSVHVTTIRL